MNIGDAVRQAKVIETWFSCAAMPSALCIRVSKAALKECVEDLRNLNNVDLCVWEFDATTRTLRIHWAT